jgi:hypothetical protein
MSQPEPRTLGWLISTLRWYEELRAEQATHTHAVLARSAEAQSRMATYFDLRRVSADLGTAPGVGRIRLLCDELDNSPGFTAANVVRLRVKVCREKSCLLEAADGLTLDKVADLLDPSAKTGPCGAAGAPSDQRGAGESGVGGRPNENEAAHSPDFRSVYWFGAEYTFTTAQAACVKVLWENWQRKTPVLAELTILDSAGLSGDRLRDVFNKGKHPAWETMIVAASKGAFRLVEPMKADPPGKPH